MLDYRPEGMSMWDMWYLETGGVAHMLHLQNLASETQRPQGDASCLGHASSTDLIHWREHPLALCPNTPGTLDDLQPWTGCIYEHGGRFYLYYTMRASADSSMGQRIGLALSDDLETWTRYPGNPIIEPDPRWYIGFDAPLAKGIVDARDLIIQPDPGGDGWFGFYAARIPAEEEAESAVVATVHSRDLIHWEHLPPAFAPGKYACIEVPDVFPLGGRWYLTGLVANLYGNRGIYSDPNCTHGTIYAVADRPEGPYREIEGDNVLIGSDGTSGYSCRSLAFAGERYVFYTQPSLAGKDTLSPPMRLVSLPDGRLRAYRSPRTEAWRQRTIIAPGEAPAIAKLPFQMAHWELPAGRWRQDGAAYHGESRTGWCVADLGVGAADMEVEARVALKSGVAAGLVYRPDGDLSYPGGDVVFAVDAAEKCALSARTPVFNDMHKRVFPVERGREYHLRVCIRRPRFELFIDDELVLQFALPVDSPPHPTLALFVDRGEATITDIAAYELG